eukprot:scaffold22179_cov78-Skeletonema_dohrnii-CCMP3373.AAC.1
MSCDVPTIIEPAATLSPPVSKFIDNAALIHSVFSEAFLVLSLRRASQAKLRLYCWILLLVVKCLQRSVGCALN